MPHKYNNKFKGKYSQGDNELQFKTKEVIKLIDMILNQEDIKFSRVRIKFELNNKQDVEDAITVLGRMQHKMEN